MNHHVRRTAHALSTLVIGVGLASLPLSFAFADTPSVSVQTQPPTSVTVGTPINVALTTAGFSNPTFTLTDSLAGTTLSNANINSSGVFSWTPSVQDIGTHTITLNVRDSSGNASAATETVTITATPSVSIQTLMPGTSVAVGSPVTFTAVPNGFSVPIAYSVTDTYGTGSTVVSSDINSSGAFSWTPTAHELGTHTIMVTVTDPYGHSANISQQVSVASGSLSVTYVNPSSTVTPGVPVLITLSPTGFSNPSYTVSDSFTNGTIASAIINPTSGTISWTPTTQDIGTHSLTIHASDTAANSGTTTTTIVVNSSAITLPPSMLAGLSAPDFQGILTILKLIGVDQSTINTVTASYTAANPSAPATTGSSGYVFTSNLAIGSTGDEVTQLQTALTAKGYYSGPITGYYGSLTAAGVKAFQSAKGISQLGIVGPQTRIALNQR
jgi:hypothetical protein